MLFGTSATKVAISDNELKVSELTFTAAMLLQVKAYLIYRMVAL